MCPDTFTDTIFLFSYIHYFKSCKFFTCPVDDPTWPSETWGMKLGFNVGNIRNRGIHLYFSYLMQCLMTFLEYLA